MMNTTFQSNLEEYVSQEDGSTVPWRGGAYDDLILTLQPCPTCGGCRKPAHPDRALAFTILRDANH
jgi:hypothetical protein